MLSSNSTLIGHSGSAPAITSPFGLCLERTAQAIVFVGIVTFALTPQYSRASGFASPQQQATASSADTTTNGAICNGEASEAKRSPQSSSSEDTGADGQSASKDRLKLSTKSGSTVAEDAEAQGQFCKRDRKDEGAQKSSSGDATPKAADHAAPQPIATLSGGKLTIKAEGESLSTILNAVKAATGITIEGPGQSESERMYLDIGPVPVRDALVALLEGSNYNYLIQSSAENPQMAKRLVLTARTNQAATTVASTQASAEPDEPSAYGAVQSDDQQAPAQVGQAPIPVQPIAVPSSVPTGINVQKMAEESHRSVGEVLSDLQKQQEQLLDQAAAQQQQQQQPPQ